MTSPNVEASLRQRFEAQLPSRIKRVNELQYNRIIGAHYFAVASRECLELYRDGYMLGCIMCAQCLLEALLKFVASRNSKPYKKDVEELIKDLANDHVLSDQAIVAAGTAWRHRNDFHHLNQGVQSVDLAAKAKECVESICIIEDDVFGSTITDGRLTPNKPIYWDIQPDGMVPVFLRQLDI